VSQELSRRFVSPASAMAIKRSFFYTIVCSEWALISWYLPLKCPRASTMDQADITSAALGLLLISFGAIESFFF